MRAQSPFSLHLKRTYYRKEAQPIWLDPLTDMAPRAGLEPATWWLTATVFNSHGRTFLPRGLRYPLLSAGFQGAALTP